MIISFKHKFILFNPPKTGTAYRESVFLEHCDLSIHKGLPISFRHASPKYLELNNWVLENRNIDDYFKFTFVRNPWERYASWFNMSAVQKNIPKKDKKKYFDEFIKTISEVQTQKDYCKYKNIFLDYIGEANQQSEEIYALQSRLNIIFNQLDQINWCDNVQSDKITRFSHPYNWRDLYDRETIDIVKNIEKYIIDLKGYTFD